MWKPTPYNPLGEYNERQAGCGLDRMANIIEATEHELVYREKKA